MGHPGARVHPPLQYTASPVNDTTQLARGQSDRQQELLILRRSTTENRSPFDISRHSALHRQLLLVPTPNLNGSQSLVGRLSVVRPSSDDIIVVEAKRPAGASAAESPSSVEAIYQVIGSSIIDPRRSTHTVVAQSPSSPLPPPLPPPPQLETRTPSIGDRPIAIPKSRLGKLRPAQRNLPTSREVVEAGPVYTRDGSLRARRPESIILAAKEETAAEPPVIEITDSYCNDIGYDLASAEIDSLYCRSFDIDLLPDAPERRLSFYNIGVNEVPAKEPEVAKPTPVEAVRPHHTLGIPSTGLPFAKPNIREDNVDFYIRMLTLRSSTNPPQQQQQQQLISPVSPAKTLPDPVVRSTSAASAHHQHRHYYSQHYSQRRSRRSQRQNRRPLTPKHRIVEEVESNRPPPVSAPVQLPTLEPAAQCIELPSVDCLRIQLPRRMSTSSGRFFFRRRPKSVPSYEAHTSGGEWPATTTTLTPRPPQQVLGEKIPAMRKSTTAATLPYTSTAPAARRWPWLGRAKSADRVLPPPTHIASSSDSSGGSVVVSEASGQLRQRRSAAYGAPLAQSPTNRLEASDDASESPGCRLACDSCWPTWTTTARRRQQQQQQQASSGNLSNSHYQQSGLLPSLASSWAHIYRSRPRNQSSQQHVGWREQRRVRRQNQQQRSVRVRDVLAYPFQLGYNCLLWWLGPCVGLARECR
ncbi:hypothetical protein GGF44_000977 [Coemansia sp. RSA 1694]|nr:hypothetical protein GGF44_000977 [Coemansia sp. RSA 1694]